jgi:hypothetical protein
LWILTFFSPFLPFFGSLKDLFAQKPLFLQKKNTVSYAKNSKKQRFFSDFCYFYKSAETSPEKKFVPKPG